MSRSWWRWLLALGSCVWLSDAGRAHQAAPEPGLLFYLSGDRGLTADIAAGGDPAPNFASDVRVIAGGAKGPGLECGHTQLLSYWAPGNIYAQRGTLSFYWRSREPVGPTPFPIFRVGYADHSSWDMVWLRIDYNGHGFDAFVTDASLARTRVSYAVPSFPAPDHWVHLTLAWDETLGIRFYVDGRMVARQDGTAVFDAALDQFGPHSRIISPYQVQSAYNFVRGGDIDEIRIYDRMLTDGGVQVLARGDRPPVLPLLVRTLAQAEWRDEWWLRNGWNRPSDAPPLLDAPAASIRKVEIHDARDVNRWWWKGTDGIRETTWPGVYNRSRLPGRNDYFQLPDWDCYSISGRSVTFTMPDEPWNQLEIAGAAWGTARLGSAENAGEVLFERARSQERTFHRLEGPVRGQAVTFFSGTTMATEGVWGWQKPNGFLAFHPAMSLVDYNGAPRVRKWLLELADGLLAHYGPDKELRTTVQFETDDDRRTGEGQIAVFSERTWPLLWAAYRWTGDRKYLAPMLDLGPRALSGISANALDHLGLRDSWRTELSAPEWMAGRADTARHVAWQMTGDVRHLESLYEDQVRAALLREYINTEGSLWIDRVQVPMIEIQRARLGGVALVRNSIVPGHAVSWRFAAEGDEEKVAILVPDATPARLTVIGYNLGAAPVEARMTTWDIEPGSWEVTIGTRKDTAAGALTSPATTTRELERSSEMPVTFAPGTCTVIQLRRVRAGMPSWQRPDLGIGRGDVRVDGNVLRVRVHSLGAVSAPSARVVLQGSDGRELASARVTGMAAPMDLEPRTSTVDLRLPAGAPWAGGTVTVDAGAGVKEISRANNVVVLR